MRSVTLFAGIALLLFGGLATYALADDFSRTKLWVRIRYPFVPQMSTAQLAKLEADPKEPKPLLLDVRTPAEYEVSHIAGARRIDPDAKTEAVLADLPPGRKVVAYCSVGARSSAFAQRLISAGRHDVYDLEGSIFQWANEGRPLEKNGKTAETVHPYNAKWGKLLDPRKRAAVPPIQ